MKTLNYDVNFKHCFILEFNRKIKILIRLSELRKKEKYIKY